jgi:hypothetical protein
MDGFWEDAVKRGYVEVVRDLLLRGIEVDARDRYGQTGLMLAARRLLRAIRPTGASAAASDGQPGQFYQYGLEREPIVGGGAGNALCVSIGRHLGHHIIQEQACAREVEI